MNSQTESQKNKYTILIVDDEQANLKLLSALVSCYGYHFETAGNGLEAMEKTKKIRPDLILLDVLMPVMNGVETCKRLKEYPDSRHIPVIVLTSLGDKETRLKCLEAGANDFLAKPVDNAELIVRVRNLLQLKEFEDRNKILTEKIQTIEAVQKIEEELKASQKELIEKNNEMKQLTESQHKELEKAYAELKAAQSQILQQEKMASIGQLAAGIAHEINNPVGFVMSNLGSLQKYADKLSEFIKAQTEAIGELGVKSSEFGEIQKKVDEFKKSLKIDYIIDDLGNLIRESLDGAERVKKIVQDLKSFSRIDEAEWKMADINAGIESTINIVWNELKYKATVKKEYGNIPLTKCNPGQLNQVFMNILINAAHAIEKQGEITVKTWHGSGFIYISISDTGKGIPSENLNRIFEPFFTTKEVGKGTGLGLSIAYDIVKKHNGDITVESKAGKGSAFTIKIPVVER
ncbi:MAG: response regulator [Nitrospiraceae bacterium]|nr:response regulator [Nitrospiraceae bacterium]